MRTATERIARTAAIGSLALLTACANMSPQGQNTAVGAGVGAALGAGLGALIGDSSQAALIGAGLALALAVALPVDDDPAHPARDGRVDARGIRGEQDQLEGGHALAHHIKLIDQMMAIFIDEKQRDQHEDHIEYQLKHVARRRQHHAIDIAQVFATNHLDQFA